MVRVLSVFRCLQSSNSSCLESRVQVRLHLLFLLPCLFSFSFVFLRGSLGLLACFCFQQTGSESRQCNCPGSKSSWVEGQTCVCSLCVVQQVGKLTAWVGKHLQLRSAKLGLWLVRVWVLCPWLRLWLANHSSKAAPHWQRHGVSDTKEFQLLTQHIYHKPREGHHPSRSATQSRCVCVCALFRQTTHCLVWKQCRSVLQAHFQLGKNKEALANGCVVLLWRSQPVVTATLDGAGGGEQQGESYLILAHAPCHMFRPWRCTFLLCDIDEADMEKASTVKPSPTMEGAASQLRPWSRTLGLPSAHHTH